MSSQPIHTAAHANAAPIPLRTPSPHTPLFVGTARQVAWAKRIYASFQKKWPGAILPSTPYAAFWIEHRDAPSPDALLSAAHTSITSSPFTVHTPRYGRDAADATLRDLDTRRWVALDTETSGLGKQHEVIELAIVDEAGRALFHSLIRPADDARLSAFDGSKAQAVNKIQVSDLEAAPTLAQVWPQALSILSDSETVTIAYNAAFDAPMLRRSAQRYGLPIPPLSMLCAMKLSSAWLESDDLYSLDEALDGVGLAGETGMSERGVRHSALADARLCAALVRAMLANTSR